MLNNNLDAPGIDAAPGSGVGAAGWSHEFPLARSHEEARIAQYVESATDVQNPVIASN